MTRRPRAWSPDGPRPSSARPRRRPGAGVRVPPRRHASPRWTRRRSCRDVDALAVERATEGVMATVAALRCRWPRSGRPHGAGRQRVAARRPRHRAGEPHAPPHRRGPPLRRGAGRGGEAAGLTVVEVPAKELAGRLAAESGLGAATGRRRHRGRREGARSAVAQGAEGGRPGRLVVLPVGLSPGGDGTGTGRARARSTTCARTSCSPSRRSRSRRGLTEPPGRGRAAGESLAQPLPAGISPRRPAWKSSKACWISARVFMTNGP